MNNIQIIDYNYSIGEAIKVYLQKFKVTLAVALQNQIVPFVKEHRYTEVTKEKNFVFYGKSKQVQEIYQKIAVISSNRSSVLIQGESGSGKELISQIIHNSGITKNKPFIKINCSVLSEDLFNKELLGKSNNMEAGDLSNIKGKFELAGEGTIFFDEICELSFDLQQKLLQVIEYKEFETDEGMTIPIRARVIASTNKNISSLVETGKFNRELLFALNVYNIKVPSLRDRKDDIPVLIVEFLNRINYELHKNVCRVPYNVVEYLQKYEWSGNTRELYNTLLLAVIKSEGEVLEIEKLPLDKPTVTCKNKTIKSSDQFNESYTLEEVEYAYILETLNKFNGNVTQACESLGITKHKLSSRLRKISPSSIN